MTDANKSEGTGRLQFSLAEFLVLCVTFASAVSFFILNYNSIWGSVNEPDKYPKTWVILKQYSQFWFSAAVVSLVAAFFAPRNYRNCLLILFVVTLVAGLYNLLLPLGML